MNARSLCLTWAVPLTLLASCDPCECVNSCSRTWEVGSGAVAERARIDNLVQGGMDCELGELPLLLKEGQTTLVAEITDRSLSGGQTIYALRVGKSAAGDQRAAECAGIAQVGTVAELHARDLEVGTPVCVVDDVHVVATCTQKGCGL